MARRTFEEGAELGMEEEIDELETPETDEVEAEINTAVTEALTMATPETSREEKINLVIEQLQELKRVDVGLGGLGEETGIGLEGMEPEEEIIR